MNKYLALLRGINVGGNNIIKMADLKTAFEEMGFSDVQTYIQSGNVIFSASEKDTEKLTVKIEKELSKKFAYKSLLVLISRKQLGEVIAKAPAGFGDEPDKYRYDVIFLKAPLDSKEAIKEIPFKEGVDQIYAGKHTIYFSRLISKASQSRLSKIVSSPIYKSVTIRNWNTSTKLSALMG